MRGPNFLQNRINAGQNPFNEDLRLAVTLQQLIGEPPCGGAKEIKEIPVSFVLFTSEPLYVGGEKFRAMRLSATYGHGEAVVGNKGIAGDTALILHSESNPDQLYVLYDNQEKPTRLVPMSKAAGIELEAVDNDPSLKNKRALSMAQVERIYRSGILMEAFYGGHPTDIEGVCKGDDVHFVQARPVNRKPMLPTYLDQSQKEAIVGKLQEQALVPGKASVVTITRKDEILFAQTLEKAQEEFPKGKYKLVVVAQPEPANSHPVVNFSSLGVPCLYAPDFKATEELASRIDSGHTAAA